MKKFILGLVSLLALTTSCNHESDWVNPNSQGQKEATFASDFNSTFNVNENDYTNHNWGMNIVPLIDLTMSGACGSNPIGNQWADNGYIVLQAITDAEREAVLAVFNQVGDASYTSLVDWNDFFVQQVYKGEKHYTAGNNGDVLGSDHMDWLCTVANQKAEVISWWPYKEEIVPCTPYDDHMFDFNNSNSNDYGGRMLMINSNTNKFGYHNTEDSKVHYEFRMEKINGNYYVGFDFYGNGNNPNQQIERDYIYNDWIVKIVPGKGTPTPNIDKVRVMCEDLGTAHSDFDYNDVVFDVIFYKNGSTYTAEITLQAAGGTLPLTVGGVEVHNKFGGYPITTMINTNSSVGDHVDGVAPVTYTVTLDGNNFSNAHEAINALPVIVNNNGSLVRLTTNPGRPAEMFAVPVGTSWANERVSIKDRYPMFVDWITDSSVIWYK